MNCGSIHNNLLTHLSINWTQSCLTTLNWKLSFEHCQASGVAVSVSIPSCFIMINLVSDCCMSDCPWQGKPDDRVILTKSAWESDGSQVPIWPSDIRLVDDFSVHLGRLQIKYREKWRGICANFQKCVSSVYLLERLSELM